VSLFLLLAALSAKLISVKQAELPELRESYRFKTVLFKTASNKEVTSPSFYLTDKLLIFLRMSLSKCSLTFMPSISISDMIGKRSFSALIISKYLLNLLI